MYLFVWVENQFKVQNGQNILCSCHKRLMIKFIFHIILLVTEFLCLVKEYYFQLSGKTITILITAKISVDCYKYSFECLHI